MTSTTPEETTQETENQSLRYREDSRLLMQALTEGSDAAAFRNPDPFAGGIRPFTQQQIENCLTDAILKRVAWSLPASATQIMWQLSLGDDYSSVKSSKIVKEYSAYHTRLKTRERIRKALKFARSHGGSVIVLKIDDGKHYSEPVNERSIKSITGLIVRHRWQVSPYTRSSFGVFDLEDIEHYEILTIDSEIKQKLLFKGSGNSLNDRLIHRSRILRFDGSLMPDDWMLAHNNGWGLSVFDEVWKYYKNYTNGLIGVGELIKTHSVLQHSFEGLRELMKSSTEDSIAAIKQTMKTIRVMYDLYGMVLHDSKEQFNWNSRPVAGMDALVNVHRDAFIGASGQPHTKLFGESPGGLGRDGKETQINWANTTAEYQGESIEPKAEILDHYMFLAKDGPTRGKMIEDYKRQYPSILRSTIEDIRSGRSTDVEALAGAIQSGFITTDEARTVPSNSDWWPELNLDQDKWEETKKKAEEQANSLGGFDMASLGGGDTPPEQNPTEESPAATEAKTDSLVQPIKRVMNWQGLNIGVTHDEGDIRHHKTMRSGYGHVRGSYGDAEDSKSIDVYINNTNSPGFFKVRQLNPDTGELDETKYFIGFESPKQVKQCFEYHAGSDRFGGVEECSPTELNQYRQDAVEPDEQDWIAQELQEQLGGEIEGWIKQIQGIIKEVGKEYSDEQTRKDELEKRLDNLDLPTDSLAEKIYRNRVLSDLAGRLHLGLES